MTGTKNATITRTLFALCGVVMLLRGGFVVLDTIRPGQWPEILVWFVGGIVAHDAVIAPLTLLLGRLFRPGPVIAAGWMGAGVVLLLAYPLLKGAQVRQNPTVIPESPALGLLQALAAVALGMLLVWGIRRALEARRAAAVIRR